jgi:hypothetical protein
MNIRTAIRRATVEMLKDPVRGFNVRMAEAAAVAPYAALKQFSLDFEPGSTNFIQAYYANDVDAGSGPLSDFPALVLYTSQAQNERREKGYGFSGTVLLHLDFYLEYRIRFGEFDGIEDFDTESIADAVEDAVLAIFHASTAYWPPGVVYDGSYSSARDPIQLNGDGWIQRVPITLALGVSA